MEKKNEECLVSPKRRRAQRILLLWVNSFDLKEFTNYSIQCGLNRWEPLGIRTHIDIIRAAAQTTNCKRFTERDCSPLRVKLMQRTLTEPARAPTAQVPAPRALMPSFMLLIRSGTASNRTSGIWRSEGAVN
ncbi:hypothetical protein EVAR_96375_1 [Eumeta japonica]|uniref:Uncharacterized protein n=1 Tax=Eumeta variegata TaxID=151549 RepID=A0A4C1WAC3_EUMVA|nr:hypothetical protein EVAR_96375_1 [Eumeta japonica]